MVVETNHEQVWVAALIGPNGESVHAAFQLLRGGFCDLFEESGKATFFLFVRRIGRDLCVAGIVQEGKGIRAGSVGLIGSAAAVVIAAVVAVVVRFRRDLTQILLLLGNGRGALTTQLEDAFDRLRAAVGVGLDK